MSRRWFSTSLTLVFVLLVAGLGYFAWIKYGQPRRMNAILLTVESFRADFVKPEIIPNLLAAAESGLRFTGHRTISAWTAPNVIAVLTGTSAFDQGVHAQRQSIPAEWKVPLETLSDAGWRVTGLQSFMQIDTFRNLGLAVEPGQELQPWLEHQSGTASPFVVWYHYLNTHLPYKPSPAFMPDLDKLLPAGDTAARARMEAVMNQPTVLHGTVAFEPTDAPAVTALHAATTREFDAWFGRFWKFFQSSGLARDTILVVTADHGDEHLERGHVGHASTTHDGHLYEELVHIPLFIWVPEDGGGRHRGQVDVQTDHMDIMPTVMRHLGLKPEITLAGRDLLADKITPARPWLGLTSKAGFQEADPYGMREFRTAMLDGKWKLHIDQLDDSPANVRLYDLQDDPKELHNLADQHPDIVARLSTPLEAAFAGRRVVRPGSGGTADALAGVPNWRVPAASAAVPFDAVAMGFRMEWNGTEGADYVIQYQAGEGLLSLKGELEVKGTSKELGPIDPSYWKNFVLPYGKIRIRVGPAGHNDRWSDWLIMTPVP